MTTLEFLIDRLMTARKWTNSLLVDIEESQWFTMPPTGGTGHIAWQIGHLAASQLVLIPNRCFNRPFTEFVTDEFRAPFMRGSTPHADPSEYPPLAEIKNFFERTQQTCIELVRSMPETELTEPAGSDPHPLFSNKAGAISVAALHETFHAGQIAMIRRSLGKNPLR